MNKLAVALAAGLMLAAPGLVAPAAAVTMTDAMEPAIALKAGDQLAQINVQIGPDRRGPRYRDRYRDRQHYRHRQVCTTRVTHRQGRRVVVRSCR